MPAASSDLRKELNGAEEDGPEHDARIFGEVTDLFLSNVGRLGDSQIAAVDGVLAHLVARVDATTVIQLSEALSTIDRAPRQTIRKLAFHEQPQVAAPVLRSSSCLSEADLLEIVKSRSQQHLLAICDRKTLNEALTDALMRFGDVNVSNALARNTGRVSPNAVTRRWWGGRSMTKGSRKSSAFAWTFPAACCGSSLARLPTSFARGS